MSMRLVFRLAASLLLVLSASSAAQDQEAALELQRLQTAVSVINGEIRANRDEIMALQMADRSSARTLDAQAQVQGQSFDDVTAAQQRVIESQAAINARINAILERNAALDAQKQPLLERIRELLQRQ